LSRQVNGYIWGNQKQLSRRGELFFVDKYKFSGDKLRELGRNPLSYLLGDPHMWGSLDSAPHISFWGKSVERLSFLSPFYPSLFCGKFEVD
jgi:hypothetical protein